MLMPMSGAARSAVVVRRQALFARRSTFRLSVVAGVLAIMAISANTFVPCVEGASADGVSNTVDNGSSASSRKLAQFEILDGLFANYKKYADDAGTTIAENDADFDEQLDDTGFFQMIFNTTSPDGTTGDLPFVSILQNGAEVMSGWMSSIAELFSEVRPSTYICWMNAGVQR